MGQWRGMDGVSEADSCAALCQASAASSASTLRIRYVPSPARACSRVLQRQAARGAESCTTLHTWHVEFASQCEHHMLPFFGTVHIGVMGAPASAAVSSALVQDIVDLYANRLQVQERITHQVADAVHQGCAGAAVVVMCTSTHMCMVARGVEKHSSATMTTAACGLAAEGPELRCSMLECLLDSAESSS